MNQLWDLPELPGVCVVLNCCQSTWDSVLSQHDVLFWGSDREKSGCFETKDFAGNRDWNCNCLLDLLSHQSHSVCNFVGLVTNTFQKPKLNMQTWYTLPM